MMRKCVAVATALLIAAAALLAVSAARSKPLAPDKRPAADNQVSPKLAEARALVRMLDEEMDMKVFQVPMKLKEALGLIHEQLAQKGKAFPVYLNTGTFKASDPDAPDLYEVDVKFPPFPSKMTVSSVLQVALGQVPGHDAATYLVRRGRIEITTNLAASPSRLLEQPVAAVFDNQPLEQALQELSAYSGASVIVDRRVADKVRMPISATFLNDTSLEGALILLADMVGATFVVVEDTLYITTPENARLLRKAHKGKKIFAAAGVG